MPWNFELILFLLTLISGIVWGAYFCSSLGKERTLFKNNNNVLPTVVEYCRSFFPVFLAVLIIRSFIVEPFRIPSGSMIPTLLVGDFIIVNKYTYGIRLPVVKTKIISNNLPKRGDVVVFRFPLDPSIPFIKRIIGLPDDTIKYEGKKVLVNGQIVVYEDEGTYLGEQTSRQYTGSKEMSEFLGEVPHRILVRPDSFSANSTFEVPLGHYFVLGDNRDNSRDSRFWGFVPEENLVGKAFYIWMSWDSGINFKRVGTVID